MRRASFTGLVEEVGPDLLALRGASGRVEIHVSGGIPIEIAVVEHATEGGMRAVRSRELRDALLARDEQVDVIVGTLQQPEGIAGTLRLSRDFVAVLGADGAETIVPLSQVAWVAAAPD